MEMVCFKVKTSHLTSIYIFYRKSVQHKFTISTTTPVRRFNLLKQDIVFTLTDTLNISLATKERLSYSTDRRSIR